MRILKTIATVTLISLAACQKTEKTTENNEGALPVVATEKTVDKTENTAIETLVKDMYAWNRNRSHTNEFQSVVKDTLVTGYNMGSHKLYLKELRDSGFFAEEFIANMDKIVQEQNKLLGSGKIEWYEGDLSPFSGDFDPWCGCQDEPAENAFSKITLHFESLNNATAKFYWNWEGFGDDWAAEHYNMRTVIENGKWKIAYMQGWDYAANLGVE